MWISALSRTAVFVTLSGDTQDLCEAEHVGGTEFLLLSNVQGAGISAIHECADNTGTVDLDLVCSVSLLLDHTRLVICDSSSEIVACGGLSTSCARICVFFRLMVSRKF